MYERFTDRSVESMKLAKQEAQRLNHEYIGTEHILLGLVGQRTGVAARVLTSFGVEVFQLRLEVERIVRSSPDQVTSEKLPLSPTAEKTLDYAMEEARDLNHNYVGTEHLL